MLNVQDVDIWFAQLAKLQMQSCSSGHNKDTPHVVIGYGSLMSKQSRTQFSNIRSSGLPITINGWERAWVTRSIDECQTYVGAYRSRNSSFNAQAFITNIDTQLQKREKDYRFSKIDRDSLILSSALDESQRAVLSRSSLYICETLEQQTPCARFPVSQTYIDTCLAGCMEVGGSDEVKRFIATTRHWPFEFTVNDRHKPVYPRAASVKTSDLAVFDEIQRIEVAK